MFDVVLNMNAVKRKTLLKRGRIDIVQFLRDLPSTHHFSKTFTVDVVSATVSMSLSSLVCIGGLVGLYYIYVYVLFVFIACWYFIRDKWNLQ